MLKNTKQWIHYVEWMFQGLFFLYAAFSFNNLTFGTFLISAVMWPMIALGIILVIYRLFHLRDYLSMPGIWLLVALLAVSVFTTLLHHEYGFKRNIIFIMYWTFYFFLLYCQRIDEPLMAQKSFRLFGILLCVYMAISVIISLVMFGVGYSNEVVMKDENYVLYSGFKFGRLWGVFNDPNSASIAACLAIGLSALFITLYSNKWIKVSFVINIVLQIVYIILSDSRTGQLSLCALIFVLALMGLPDLLKFRADLWKKAVALVGSICATLLTFFGVNFLKTTYNTVATYIFEQSSHKPPIEPEDPNQGNNTTDNKVGDWLIDRKYSLDEDISNRRFDMWYSGYEIWKESPIWGVSFAAMLPYAEEHLPNTYIVKNDYQKMSSMENEPMNILVSNGILGIVAYLGFAVFLLIYLMHRIFRVENAYKKEVKFAFGIITMMTIASLVRGTMFFYNSPNANYFWMILGYLVVFASTAKIGKRNEETVND